MVPVWSHYAHRAKSNEATSHKPSEYIPRRKIEEGVAKKGNVGRESCQSPFFQGVVECVTLWPLMRSGSPDSSGLRAASQFRLPLSQLSTFIRRAFWRIYPLRNLADKLLSTSFSGTRAGMLRNVAFVDSIFWGSFTEVRLDKPLCSSHRQQNRPPS